MSLLQFLFLTCVFAVGYSLGWYFEQRHYKSLAARERRTKRIKLTSNVGEYIDPTFVPESVDANQEVTAKLVMGACVLSVSYFKQLEIFLRQLFGGRIRTYEALVDRARREAILRLKEKCRNAESVINLRVETAAIAQGKQESRCVEVLAYATAIYRFAPPAQSTAHERVWP